MRLIVLVLFASCAAPPASKAPPRQTSPLTSASFRPTAASPARADSVEQAPPAVTTLADALCGTAPNCELKETLGAVAGVEGGTRAAVRITYPEAVTEGETPCTWEEYWLVERDGQGKVEQQIQFAQGCAEGSPTESWCGLPPTASVHVEGSVATVNWFAPDMRCAGGGRSMGTERISLETFRSLYSETNSYRSMPADQDVTRTWDWQTFSGSLAWSAGSDSCRSLRRGPLPSIPRLAIDAGFVDGGWRQLPMASCATRIGEKQAVSLGGKKANVSLSAVIARGDTLFVEVESTLGEPLTPDARLRICTAEFVPAFYWHCEAKETPACSDLSLDGSTISGELRAERSAERPRLKVPLPAERSALTIAYIEPKSGRSLSSSPLKPFDSRSMSSVFDLEPEAVSCEVRAGVLNLVRQPDAL